MILHLYPPEKEPPVSIVYEAGWVPTYRDTVEKKKKISYPCRKSNPAIQR
jgi:hypothetical protein